MKPLLPQWPTLLRLRLRRHLAMHLLQPPPLLLQKQLL
jgi:hypothetical protein